MRAHLFLIVVSVLALGALAETKEKATRNVVVTAEDEKIRDAAGYEAIAEIHREMDDDHSGSIDRKETSGFMTEDMHMRSSDRVRRENAFHGDDDAITIDDLWEAWFESEERAWTNEQVLNWIVNVMNLPQYAERIVKSKIDGTVLPRLAVHNSTFMSQKLGIKSSVHRQKLRLNALDVVLFGYRDSSSKSKDIALALLLLLLTSVLILYVRQKRRARLEVSELSSRLTQLKSMESEFEDVQKKWSEERSKRSTADGAISHTEMENLRVQLEEAERRLEEGGSGGGTPLALQPLLRRTCESEMSFMEKQRQDCFREMKEAIEMVDRLQKKQSSVLSSLKLATGAATASDQVDSKIFALKSRMEKIHALTRDTQERWLQIESLCGFPILYMNEAVPGGMYHSPSSSHFYASNSGSSSISSKSLVNGHGGPAVTSKASTAARPAPAPSSMAGSGHHSQATPTSSVPMRHPEHHHQPEATVLFTAGSAPLQSPSFSLEDGRTPPIRMTPLHADVSPLRSDDSQSLASSNETKKRKGIRKLTDRLFSKSSSKGSLNSLVSPTK